LPENPPHTDFHRRHAVKLLLAAAACVPLIAWALLHVHESSDNSIDQWLPQDYEATDVYYRFRDHFGSDEVVLVSWEGCTLDDPRLEQFAAAVEGEDGKPRLAGLAEVFEHVTTGQLAQKQLSMRPVSIPRDEAIGRLRAVLIGPDGETTCAVVTLAADTSRKRIDAVDDIREIATDRCGVPEDDLRLTGDAVVSVAIDTEAEQAISGLIWLSGLLAISIAWACLRSIKLAILVFALSAFCEGVSEALIYYTGGSMNLLVILVPVLVFVLSVSASVHLANYYRDAVRLHGPEAAPREALRAGWQPCLIAAVTTALGLVSLGVSHVVPVRSFGLYGAAGVLASFGVLALLLPAATVRFPVVPRAGTGVGEPPLVDQKQFVRLMADKMIARPWFVLVPFAVVFVAAAVGLSKVRSSVEPVRFLPQDSRWITDLLWYSRNVGPLASVEIVVGFHDDMELEFGDRMRVIRDVQQSVQQLKRVEGTVSAATFAPRLGPILRGRTGFRQHARYAGINRLLQANRDEFLQDRYLAEDGQWEIWRITARVSKFSDLDYPQFEQHLNAKVQAALDDAKIPPEVRRVNYTGGVPLVFAAQRELLVALIISFALAMVLITVVMILVLRSIPGGLLAMLPNVFPAWITFGILGWTGALVDVGAMMTASIGLGIAVDDTLHFLTWFRRASAEGAGRHDAIRVALGRCAPAMTHTTLIAGLALFVFFFSSFQPVSQFGLLLFTLLVAALVGDLLLLPALLATPVGALFQRGTRRKDRTS
jgi:predicted RND superfamily exporter protein